MNNKQHECSKKMEKKTIYGKGNFIAKQSWALKKKFPLSQ
jgi:hypothetical protein